MHEPSPRPPRTVVLAGALVIAQAAIGLVFAVLLLIRALGGNSELGSGNVLGQAAYFAAIAGGVLACGIGLVLGRHWSRGPAIVTQLLLLGVSWYAAGPSNRPEYGIPAAVVCAAVLVLLVSGPSREWALGEPERGDAEG